MKQHLYTVIAVTVLSMFSTAAFAGDDGDAKARVAKRVDEAFTRLDTNKDGKLSHDEASKGRRIAKHFDDIDADHDGFVTRAELGAAIARHAKP